MKMRKRIILGYGAGSLFFLIGSLVYLSFVPGVRNIPMQTAFSYLLLAGIFESIFANPLARFEWTKTSFRLGITTLSVVSFTQGILDIALAYHPWIQYVWLIGVTISLISGVFLLARLIDR
jgi:hypothetical protein